MNLDINFLAVLLAAVASMGVGFGWYSPLLFANRWMKLMGHTPASIKKEQSKMSLYYGLSFVAALVTAFVLAHVSGMSQRVFGYAPIMSGISTAFWMWIGFVAPVQMTDVIFGNKKWELFGINTGYQFVSMLVMGVIVNLF